MATEPARLVGARLAHARAVKAGAPDRVRSTRDRYALERARWLVTQAGELVAELDAPLKAELASALRELADALNHD